MNKITLLLIAFISFVGFSQETAELKEKAKMLQEKLQKVANEDTFAPSEETKKADYYFDRLSFVKAAELYKELSEEPTAYIYQQLGDSNYFYANMEPAEEAYAQLFGKYDNKKIASEYYFRYAQALRSNGKYKASDKWMKKFNQLKKDDDRGDNFSKDVGNQDNLLKDPMYRVENLRGINTEYSDFGTAVYRDSLLVYASADPRQRFVKRTHTWNDQPFLQLYSAPKHRAGEEEVDENIKQFSKRLNTIYHESSIVFTPNEEVAYFTRNNYNDGKYRTDRKGTNNLKIYRARKTKRGWKNVYSLPFNSNEYSVGHPTLTKDGKRMYFTSDMPGGMGQTDIFYVDIKTNEETGAISYSKPINAGPTINTEGKEMFPHIAEDGTLYFSSDGHFGLGGLDIFSTIQKDDVFQRPQNLRAPANTESDDFAFTINSETRRGYLSSNRAGGKGDDDIYSVAQIKAPTPAPEPEPEPVVVEECTITKRGIVRDRYTKQIIPYARVTLYDAAGQEISKSQTGADARFSFSNIECDKTYSVKGEKSIYKPDTATFKAEKATAELELALDLDLQPEFTYSRRNDIIIKIRDIYFDYDKSNIRPDAQVELNQIIRVMQQYPSIVVESGSHTDARGRSAYNEALSDRRAKSSVGWITQRGVSSSRISGRGYGETQLVNGCTDNDQHTDRVRCSKAEHQQNRRTEFRIVSF